MSMISRKSRLRIIRWMCVVGAILLGGLALGMWENTTSPPRPHQTHPLTGMAGPTAPPPARIYLRDLVLDAQTLTRSTPPSAATEDGFRLWLVQFPGPIQDAWYDAMVRAELSVISYIPDFTYLVWGKANAVSALRKQAPVRWWAPYAPEYALHPTLRGTLAGTQPLTVVVQVVDHPTARSTLKAKGYERDAPLSAIPGTQTWRIRTTRDAVQEIAALPGVVNVEPALVPRLHDERQAVIMMGRLDPDGIAPTGPGYLHWLTATVGMTTTPTAYPIVDVTDDGIDDGDTAPSHPDFYAFGDLRNEDRLVYNANWTGDLLADGKGGHGTLNAAIVAGYNDRTGIAYEDTAGYNYGLGINPFGRVAGSKVFDNNANWTSPDYTELIADAYQRGARISSNSWGASAGQGRYRVYDQIYDARVRDADPDAPGNQAMVVIFSAGNSGPDDQTVGSPANAKNVITVGAAEGTRPTWLDGCGYGPTSADNANDIAPFSGRGPTADGRVKPDLVAPGTHIIAAASQTSDYTGHNVCDPYYPLEQTLYAASSGTSHAAPAVAGAASLLTHRYESWTGAPPSPAMIKAMLLNTARYLDGVDSGDTLPSASQGHGEVNVAAALSETARIVVDQSEVMRATGETYVVSGRISRTDAPVRITLAWTDAPGSTVGNAYVNDLDLTVEISGTTYLGNVFDGAYATTGGVHDRVNNVESVFIPPGARGPLTITVRAYNLAGDGVPGNPDPTDQDFALVCTHCDAGPAFDLEVRPLHVDLCASETTTYTVTPYARGGFSDSISLQVTGYPVGTTAAFDPNPVPADTSSLLTLVTSAEAAPGPYAMPISGRGTSATESATATLHLYAGPPMSPSLHTPQDGVQNVAPRPTFDWFPVAGAQGYRLEITEQASVETPVYSATVEATSHTVTDPLAYDTPYRWRVIPLNPCAEGPSSPVWRFTTQTAPQYLCQDVGRSITDLTTLTTTLIASETLPLFDLDVALTATHSWVGDLVITLTHEETGVDVVLFDRPGVPDTTFGCGGQDLDIRFDDEADKRIEDNCHNVQPAYSPGDTFQPDERLSATDGYGISGRWRLDVTDKAEGDEGTLDRWCLIPTLMSGGDVPGVAFEQTDYPTSKLSGTVPISVTLSPAAPQTVTVRYATEDGSALAGVHYLTATGTLTFAPGSTRRTFAVPVISPTIRSVTRMLRLGLSTPRYAVLTGPLTSTLRLTPPAPWRFTYLPLVLNQRLR